MKKTLLILIVFLFCHCDEPEDSEESLISDQSAAVPAPSLAGNSMGNPTEQPIRVYFPKEMEPNRNYPVIYWFHGFGSNQDSMTSQASSAQHAMAAGKYPHAIQVLVNGATVNGGSFWVNSPITGNWEDLVINDIVPWVDDNFPTIAEPRGRGLFGFSMGGFAVLNLGLKYPDVFSVVFALSPGVLKPGALPSAMSTWLEDTTFLNAYARAFSPNVDTNSGNIPDMNDTPEDQAIQADWIAGFGDFDKKISAYQSLETDLEAIRINYGIADYYGWIPEGSAYLIELMGKESLPASGTGFARGHEVNTAIVLDEVMPFFQEHLDAS